MIKVNKCAVTADNKYLQIDIEVACNQYTQNIYLDNIIIYTESTYSGKPKGQYPLSINVNEPPVIAPNHCTDYEHNQDGTKHYSTLIDIDGLGQNLFIIEVKVTGTYPANTPCSINKKTFYVSAYNDYKLYLKGMDYIKELNGGCTPPRGFMDYMLQYKAFTLALELGDFPQAIEYFNKFFGKEELTHKINNSCCCHG